MYKGIIIEESLEDVRDLSSFSILETNVSGTWHIHTVEANEQAILRLPELLKAGTWYAHFWTGDDVIAVFHEKVFRFKHSDISTWADALSYGRSLGIPDEQLDFPITS